jgi:hypothetical protein
MISGDRKRNGYFSIQIGWRGRIEFGMGMGVGD